MAFLTATTITSSCLASAAPQADSWWLGHVEPDDVVIADMVGQALDSFLHGPESAHKNGIAKTFTHTSIPTHPCTHLKDEKKETKWNAQLTKHDAFLYWSSSCPVRWWSTCTRSTSEALSPRTVVTENVCESVQQILQHSPPIMPFLTTSTLTDAPMHTPKATKSETLNSPNLTPSISCPLAVQCGGRRPPESLAGALQDWSTSEVFSPRTVLTENIGRRVQEIDRKTNGPATMAFLTTSTITLSCLASAAPQADSWWLGPVVPDDVVIADTGGQALDIFPHGPESAHKNGILKTFTHTSIPIHPCVLLK